MTGPLVGIVDDEETECGERRVTLLFWGWVGLLFFGGSLSQKRGGSLIIRWVGLLRHISQGVTGQSDATPLIEEHLSFFASADRRRCFCRRFACFLAKPARTRAYSHAIALFLSRTDVHRQTIDKQR